MLLRRVQDGWIRLRMAMRHKPECFRAYIKNYLLKRCHRMLAHGMDLGFNYYQNYDQPELLGQTQGPIS